MLQLIATFILIDSIFGMALILYRKIPDLKNLPKPKEDDSKKIKILRLKIKNLSFLNPDFAENFLQKLLSGTKVLALKIENRCSNTLQSMRTKTIQKQKAKKDRYWQKLKKSVVTYKKKKE